jgi:hypothetical protein
MPIRNPFAKKTDVSTGAQDENRRPPNGTRPTFEKVDTIGSKASSSLSINTGKSEEPAEYKMSGKMPLLPRQCSSPWVSHGLTDNWLMATCSGQ